MSNIKKIKATKRTVSINSRKYFLEFPEILKTDDQYAIHLNGKYYYLPLPNIDFSNNICHGDSTPEYFWNSEFVGSCTVFDGAIVYTQWAKCGFQIIKNKLLEMPSNVSYKFIETATFEDVKRSINLFMKLPFDQQTKEVQMYIIQKDPTFGIKYILNHCDEAIDYIVKNRPKLIRLFSKPVIAKIKEKYGIKVMLHLL